jgi:hypothetical protein
LSLLYAIHPISTRIFVLLISVRCWVNHRAIVRHRGLVRLNYASTNYTATCPWKHKPVCISKKPKDSKDVQEFLQFKAVKNRCRIGIKLMLLYIPLRKGFSVADSIYCMYSVQLCYVFNNEWMMGPSVIPVARNGNCSFQGFLLLRWFWIMYRCIISFMILSTIYRELPKTNIVVGGMHFQCNCGLMKSRSLEGLHLQTVA